MTPIAEITRNVVLAMAENALRTTAHQAAAQIEQLDGLTPGQRCDMRGLPMEMLRIADMMTTARDMLGASPTMADGWRARLGGGS